MKTIFRQIIFVAAIIAFFLTSAQNIFTSKTDSLPQESRTYYVSPTGNDTNPCSLAAPCKSFKRAVHLASSGDLIIALGGEYKQSLIISKSGITIEGHNAIINTTGHGIHIQSSASNIIVRGLTVTGSISHGIFVEGKSVQLRIILCIIRFWKMGSFLKVCLPARTENGGRQLSWDMVHQI